MRWVHGVLTIFWLILWVVAGLAGWIKSVTFVSHLSVAALVLASFAGWQGARAEEKADDGGSESP